VERVFVLSRVTLGRMLPSPASSWMRPSGRFPAARIFLVGQRKAWELFEADPRIEHLPVAYPRSGTLRERLTAWHALRDALIRRGASSSIPIPV